MSNWKKVMLVTLTAIMTIAPLATGCGDKKPATNNNNNNSSATTSAANNKADSSSVVLAPGVDTEGQVGTAVDMKDITITLTEIYEPAKAPESRNSQFIVCKFTLKNNSSDTYIINSLENFAVFVDSKQDTKALFSNAPLVAASTLEDVTSFSGEVAGGGVLEGIIGMEVPKNWQSLKLVYTPFFGTSNDTISYNISSDKIVPRY